MKRTFFACITGIVLNWATTSISYSQKVSGPERPEAISESRIELPVEKDLSKSGDPIAPGEINGKAVKNFTRDYKNVTNASWFRSEDGFAAYFTIDGIKNRVFYDKKGRWAGMIRDYAEDKLPHDVRHLIKSTYYDFSITHVNEVTYDGVTAYLVHMEDKTHWKTIKVIDGEMEVQDDYVKR